MITRQELLDYFRSDAFIEDLTDEDKYYIALQCVCGSDYIYEKLKELIKHREKNMEKVIEKTNGKTDRKMVYATVRKDLLNQKLYPSSTHFVTSSEWHDFTFPVVPLDFEIECGDHDESYNMLIQHPLTLEYMGVYSADFEFDNWSKK